ncbi:MAG: FeoB-associated Cys-rich membrane protein [Eggerthellaceae bacterium]|nr:FeoB-associated Cys-rich membrane protein [Eggerthellaceae bacterium]
MPDLGTIIAIALLILAAIIAFRLIRKRAKGDTGCGCGCSGCSSSSLALLNGENQSGSEDLPPCCKKPEACIDGK